MTADEQVWREGYGSVEPKYATDEDCQKALQPMLGARLQQETSEVARHTLPELQRRYKATQRHFPFLTGNPKPEQPATRVCESYLLAYIRELKRAHANQILDGEGRITGAEKDRADALRVVGSLRATIETQENQLRHLRAQVKTL